MPLFRKSKSSNNNTLPPAPAPSPGPRYSARSAEHLVHPAFAPPDHSSSSIEDAYSDRRLSDYRFAHQETSHPHPHPRPHQPQHPPAQPHSETNQPSLHRSQSQRQPHHSQHNRASVNSLVAPEDPQPRRLKESLSVWPSSGFLGRSVSVKGKSISHPISQPTSPRVPHHLDTTEEELHNHPAYSENSSPVTTQTQHTYEPRSASLAYQQQHQQFQRASRENPEWSQQPPASALSLIPPPLERSSTDTSLLERYNRPSPTEPAPESPLYPPDQGHRGQPHSRIQQDLVLNARPPSRPTYEPLSPAPSQNYPDAMQAQSQQTSNDRSQGSQQDSSRRGSASQNMPEPGRNTPTPNRTREDPSEIDVRALLQKHEELREFDIEEALGNDANVLQNLNTPR